MTAIWLSPGLPAPASSVVAGLGPGVELASGSVPPPGTAVAVATVFDRLLLEQLAAASAAGRLVLLKPPGSATPDLPNLPGPVTVVEAADVDAVVSSVREAIEAPTVSWSAPAAGLEAASAAVPGPWLQEPTSTGPLPSTVPAAAGVRSSRRNWLASGGIVGAAALAAVVVLATQGGASGSQAQGFSRGFPPGAAGYGGSLPPGGSQDGAAQAPGAGGVPDGAMGRAGDDDGDGDEDEAGRAAARQAFLGCLSENGVDVQSLRSGERPRLDPSDPALSTALQQCASLMPRPGMPGGPGMRGAGDNSDGDNSDGDRAPDRLTR